ncbi:MAG: DUF362 domain-containing protein [Spirochaetia bacterium]
MGKISIVKIINTIKDSLYTSLELIGGVGAFLQPDDIVLLKPNLNDSQSFTSPELVSGLIEILFDFNIKNIFIAESTFGNEHITANHFNKTGYKDMAEKFGIDLININKSRVIEKTVRHPFALDRLQLGAEVDRATKIINLPVMKVHYATGVTLCLKNLKAIAEVRRPFKRAEIKDAVPANFTVHNVNACSACENALLLSFKFMHNPPNGSYHIFIGPKVENTDYLPHSIGFGNCCKMKDIDIKIKGCPPYPPALARELEERERNK